MVWGIGLPGGLGACAGGVCRRVVVCLSARRRPGCPRLRPCVSVSSRCVLGINSSHSHLCVNSTGTLHLKLVKLGARCRARRHGASAPITHTHTHGDTQQRRAARRSACAPPSHTMAPAPAAPWLPLLTNMRHTCAGLCGAQGHSTSCLPRRPTCAHGGLRCTSQCSTHLASVRALHS